jgi:hypothetical protein
MVVLFSSQILYLMIIAYVYLISYVLKTYVFDMLFMSLLHPFRTHLILPCHTLSCWCCCTTLRHSVKQTGFFNCKPGLFYPSMLCCICVYRLIHPAVLSSVFRGRAVLTTLVKLSQSDAPSGQYTNVHSWMYVLGSTLAPSVFRSFGFEVDCPTGFRHMTHIK